MSPRPIRLATNLAIVLLCWAPNGASLAADYLLTVGGGYNPSGNQASLEANVLFFQHLLADKHVGARRHEIFFADGDDPAADLQILDEKSAGGDSPATELLASLHRRRGETRLTYRNHHVAEITGPLDPQRIRAGLEELAKTAQSGDRLIVYVTAHGSAGPQNDPFNTTIDCWDERKISAREFTDWLDKLPQAMPVVMVMAQCYCGGFAHTIFQGLDEAKGLAPQLRVGFFAQRYDLPAAGCRPDIEHDEEFSSYFWGAIAGRSRNGAPIEGCDLDNNGAVSFAEAHAYAVVAGETIDIPLKASEVLLRTFSRLREKADAAGADSEIESEIPKGSGQLSEDNTSAPDQGVKQEPVLSTTTGTLQSFVDRARPVSRRIVTELSRTLGFTLNDEVASVTAAYNGLRRAGLSQGRMSDRRRGLGRRNVLREVSEKWPELGDARHWQESTLLKPENQEQLLAELKQLPAWKNYDERRKQIEAIGEEGERDELRRVKFRRLIYAIETIVLEANLALVATPEINERYRQMLILEESSL